jgi:hypothetical protein
MSFGRSDEGFGRDKIGKKAKTTADPYGMTNKKSNRKCKKINRG